MAIQFKEIRQYLARNARLSICFEDGYYQDYLMVSDIPTEKYKDWRIWTIGAKNLWELFSKGYIVLESTYRASFTNCYKRTADAGGKNNMAENQSRAGKPFGEIMMKNSPICMAPRELAEVCQKKKFVVLVSRNDKENSEYAAEVCETK